MSLLLLTIYMGRFFLCVCCVLVRCVGEKKNVAYKKKMSLLLLTIYINRAARFACCLSRCRFFY